MGAHYSFYVKTIETCARAFLTLNILALGRVRVLQTIQMTLILLCVWAETGVFGSAKTALKFKYEIYIRLTHIQFIFMGQGISLKSERKNP
jgi:hypothetical protein